MDEGAGSGQPPRPRATSRPLRPACRARCRVPARRISPSCRLRSPRPQHVAQVGKGEALDLGRVVARCVEGRRRGSAARRPRSRGCAGRRPCAARRCRCRPRRRRPHRAQARPAGRSSPVPKNPEKRRLRTTVAAAASGASSATISSSPEPLTQCGGNTANSASSGSWVSARKMGTAPAADLCLEVGPDGGHDGGQAGAREVTVAAEAVHEIDDDDRLHADPSGRCRGLRPAARS